MGCLGDVGNNCDFACWLASLFTFIAGFVEYGRNPYFHHRKSRENDRKRQEWLDKIKEFSEDFKERYPDPRTRPSGPELYRQLPPRPDYFPVPGPGDDPLMWLYKFYQDTQIFVGGEEKRTSMPAGLA